MKQGKVVMKIRDLSENETLLSCLQSFYRRSGLRNLGHCLKGIKLHWIMYLVLSSLLVGGLLWLHNYYHHHFYVVRVNDHEVGLVRDAGEVEVFLEQLMDQCSLLYGMEVMPDQDITLAREYRPGEEADLFKTTEALRNRISLSTEAIMIMVDGSPVVPVYTEQEIDTVIELLSMAYISQDDNTKLLEAELVQEIYGESCVVPPENVYKPAEVAALLTKQDQQQEQFAATREVTLSRSGTNSPEEHGARIPVVTVITLEETTLEERIPFSTTYANTGSMFIGQSRVATSGKDGLKEVAYRVTRENGIETDREATAERVIQDPVTQVVERGTTPRFTWPVAGGGRLTQYFRGSAHRGIDIAASMGTAILAANAGVVVISENRWPMGNYIVLKHGSYWTLYLHNSRNLVWAGQKVSRGQTIAYLGSTGRSTGPHLHFEIRRCNGSGVWNSWTAHPAINPLQFW